MVIGCGSTIGFWLFSPSMNIHAGISFISWLDWVSIICATFGMLYLVVISSDLNFVRVLDYFLFFSFGVLVIRRIMSKT
jgi:hypothetical protein